MLSPGPRQDTPLRTSVVHRARYGREDAGWCTQGGIGRYTLGRCTPTMVHREHIPGYLSSHQGMPPLFPPGYASSFPTMVHRLSTPHGAQAVYPPWYPSGVSHHGTRAVYPTLRAWCTYSTRHIGSMVHIQHPAHREASTLRISTLGTMVGGHSAHQYPGTMGEGGLCATVPTNLLGKRGRTMRKVGPPS